MEILFLGTGAGMPSKQRNVTSIALKLLAERKEVWLFDCGEGTQHQILSTSLKPRKVSKLFITHLHGDHIYGLPGFISSRAFLGGEDLSIYGPKGIKEYILTSLKISQTYLKHDLHFYEFTEDGIIFEDDTFKVEVAKLDHGIDSYGFRVIEKDRPGELLVEQLKQAGVKPGPIYKEIKAGKDITLEDGTTIIAKEYVGEAKKGKIVTILGDTRYCDAARELAKDSDLLVHEATFAKGEEELAYTYHHSTTLQAATIAKEACVKRLLVTHISSRYDVKDIKMIVNQLREVVENSDVTFDFYEEQIGV